MKQIVAVILFSFNSIFGFSQTGRPIGKVYDAFGVSLEERYEMFAKRPIPDQKWKHLDISEDCCVLKHIDGTQFYVGKVKKNIYYQDISNFYAPSVSEETQTRFIRTGAGVLKIISNEGIRYISGTWKRDFLTGDSLIKDDNGEVYFCKWKLGKIVKNSQREATEEEKKKMEQAIKKCNTKIRLSAL